MNSEAWRLIDYITFKLDCAREQEALRWKLDVAKASMHLAEWQGMKEDKVEQLANAMPRHVLTKVQNRPKVMYRKDGSLSSHGENFEALRKQYKQPETVQGFVVQTGVERGNPNSVSQIKDWLFSIGWQPRTFKFVRESNGDERQIEQVRKDGELCPSVKKLASVTILLFLFWMVFLFLLTESGYSRRS